MKSIVFLFIFASTAVYAADEVTYLDFGGKVPSVGPFDVRFNYNADANRDCEIAIKKPSEGWKQYAWKRISCQGGVGQMKIVTLTWSGAIPAAADYVVEIKFFNNGAQSGWYGLPVTVEYGKQGFYTSDADIYDANGNKFLIRGMNNMHIYWDSWGRWWARSAIKNIAYTKSNLVRIVWDVETASNSNLGSVDLDSIIAECIKHKQVPMIELHDGTCKDDRNKLMLMAQFYANNAWLLVKYRKYVMVNIANEWGFDLVQWRDAYKEAISIIRNAGYSGVLVIDGTDCGGNPKGPSTYGQELIAADPYKNIVFSVHLYFEWGRAGKKYVIDTEFSNFRTKKIPLIIGEFGSRHPHTWEGKCFESDLDVVHVMTEALKQSIGYIGWTWNGNSHEWCGPQVLDIAANHDWNSWGSYSRWGNELINTNGVGIRDTSKLATIF